MSLYNMLMGKNSDSEKILLLSGLDKIDFMRFRDVWLDKERKVTCVYTRLGGGNRECYCEDGEEHYCYMQGIAEIQNHTLYIKDYDDDFDSTYATFEFKWPEETAEALGLLADDKLPLSGDERWKLVFKALEGKTKGEL